MGQASCGAQAPDARCWRPQARLGDGTREALEHYAKQGPPQWLDRAAARDSPPPPTDGATMPTAARTGNHEASMVFGEFDLAMGEGHEASERERKVANTSAGIGITELGFGRMSVQPAAPFGAEPNAGWAKPCPASSGPRASAPPHDMCCRSHRYLSESDLQGPTPTKLAATPTWQFKPMFQHTMPLNDTHNPSSPHTRTNLAVFLQRLTGSAPRHGPAIAFACSASSELCKAACAVRASISHIITRPCCICNCLASSCGGPPCHTATSTDNYMLVAVRRQETKVSRTCPPYRLRSVWRDRRTLRPEWHNPSRT